MFLWVTNLQETISAFSIDLNTILMLTVIFLKIGFIKMLTKLMHFINKKQYILCTVYNTGINIWEIQRRLYLMI